MGFCLKWSPVRTKSVSEQGILSEVEPDSDKTTFRARGFVWSDARFGQNHVPSLRFCLKRCQVRTKTCSGHEILSEVKPGSDKIKSRAWDFVWRDARFGQNNVPSKVFCLKWCRFRTKQLSERGILSEVMQVSDKTASKVWDFVWSEARFGQNHVPGMGFCLKSCQVRTKQLSEQGILSEVKPGSDKITSQAWDFVWSEARFRQNNLPSKVFCLKWSPVRTKSCSGHEILSEEMPGSDKIMFRAWDFVWSDARFGQNQFPSKGFCLKSCQVRTKSCSGDEILSEVMPGSDKTTFRARDFVWSEARFGQNHVLSMRFCLKWCQVRTKSCSGHEILSEVEPGSDKTASWAWDFVWSDARFGQNQASNMRFCLKWCQVRTKQRPQHKILSEVMLGSDKISFRAWDFVRSHTREVLESTKPTRS